MSTASASGNKYSDIRVFHTQRKDSPAGDSPLPPLTPQKAITRPYRTLRAVLVRTVMTSLPSRIVALLPGVRHNNTRLRQASHCIWPSKSMKVNTPKTQSWRAGPFRTNNENKTQFEAALLIQCHQYNTLSLRLDGGPREQDARTARDNRQRCHRVEHDFLQPCPHGTSHSGSIRNSAGRGRADGRCCSPDAQQELSRNELLPGRLLRSYAAALTAIVIYTNSIHINSTIQL